MQRFLLASLILWLAPVFLISCGTAQYEEGYELGFKEGYDKGYHEGFQASEEKATTETTSPKTVEVVDESKFTEDEILARIWKALPRKLSDDYEIDQFKVETRIAEYVGNRKWRFEVQGIGEERITAPTTTEKKSEVLWIDRIKEKVTTYDLRLQADYFENGAILEITQIDKLNEQSLLETVSETTLRARLEVKYLEARKGGWSYQFEGDVLNIGSIPINNVSIKVSWAEVEEPSVLTQEAPVYTETLLGEPYAGNLLPGETAHFKINFIDKRELLWEMEFFSSSGELIPYDFSEELLEEWLR